MPLKIKLHQKNESNALTVLKKQKELANKEQRWSSCTAWYGERVVNIARQITLDCVYMSTYSPVII